MTNRLRIIFSMILALLIFALAGWLVLALAQLVWRALIGVNPQLAVSVVAAATTLIATTLTVMIGRYFERKKEIEAHFRAEKIRIYDEFLVELFKVFQGGDETSNMLHVFMSQWQQKLVLWGGSNVLSTYIKWMNRLKATEPDAQGFMLMDEFFRALRRDIGQSSAGLEKGAFSNLILKHGAFFLDQAKKNPNITLAELSALEKAHFGE